MTGILPIPCIVLSTISFCSLFHAEENLDFLIRFIIFLVTIWLIYQAGEIEWQQEEDDRNVFKPKTQSDRYYQQIDACRRLAIELKLHVE